MTGADRTFPIRLDDTIRTVPWDLLEPHEPQVWKNHKCSLVALAAGGGITPEEAIAIIEDRPFERMGRTYSTLRLQELVNQWKGVNTPVLARKPLAVLTTFAERSLDERLQHGIEMVQLFREGKRIPHRVLYNELEQVLQAAREALK